MFETLSDHAQRQRLDAGNRLIPVGAVAEHSRQRWHVGEPAAVGLLLQFNAERHVRNVPPRLGPNKPAVSETAGCVFAVSRSHETRAGGGTIGYQGAA